MQEFEIRRIIREEIRAFFSEETATVTEAPGELDIRLEITKVIKEMGVKPHLCGYRYLRDAVEIVCENPMVLHKMCKHVYPEVAERHETIPNRIERGIRHAIENANLKKIFGHKPTNAEVIATIAEKVREKQLLAVN